MQAIVDPTEAAEFAASVVRRHLPDPAYRVFLFGSRATGQKKTVSLNCSFATLAMEFGLLENRSSRLARGVSYFKRLPSAVYDRKSCRVGGLLCTIR